jgi:hypothetical protein
MARSYMEAQTKISSQGQTLSELSRENDRLAVELEGLLQGRAELAARIALLERAYVASMGAAK